MIGAFAYVAFHSAKNRVLFRLRRLRQPRYLISAILAIVYFWFFFYRRSAGSNRNAIPPQMLGAIGDFGMSAVAAAIFVIMVLAWALPEDSGGLEFTPAEVQFLFTAPVSRPQLLLYKIFRSQAQILFSVAIFSFFTRLRANVFGFWFAFSVMTLYFTMVKLGRARLRQAHVGFFGRLAAAVALLAGVYLAVVHQISGTFRLLPSIKPDQFLKVISAPFHQEPLRSLTFVPKLMVKTAVSHDLTVALPSAAMLAGVAVLIFWIAVWFDVSFEESSVIASQKKADEKLKDALRGRGRQVTFRKMPAPFRLAGEGRPEVAIFWKNLIAAGRVSSLFILLVLGVALFVMFMMILGHKAGKDAMFTLTGTMTLATGGMFALFGPLFLKNDLRFDINRLEVLKSYPISGERIFLAEVAAPFAITSVIEMAALFTGFLQLRAGLGSKAAFFTSPEFLVAAMIFALPVTAVEYVIHNGAVILFPGWAVPSKEEVRGFAATGFGMLVMLVHIVTLAVFLIPAAIAFVPVFFIAAKFTAAATAVAIAAIPAVAIVLVELQFAVHFLGEQFEDVDVSNDVEPTAA